MTRMRTLQSWGTPSGARAEQIAQLGPWFHNLHLPDGVQTASDHPLGDFPRNVWEQLAPALPADLHGARALDIGCNAGFYSFALAARGADVLAIDVDPHYLRQADWARAQLPEGRRVRLQQRQVYELHRIDGEFDLVMFMGVIYHLRYPLLALDLVAEKARGLLVFQSLTTRTEAPEIATSEVAYDEIDRLDHPGWPRMAFVEGELAGDQSNWWIPNPACIDALVRAAGLEVAARPAREVVVCRRVEDFDAFRSDARRELSAAAQIDARMYSQAGE